MRRWQRRWWWPRQDEWNNLVVQVAQQSSFRHAKPVVTVTIVCQLLISDVMYDAVLSWILSYHVVIAINAWIQFK